MAYTYLFDTEPFTVTSLQKTDQKIRQGITHPIILIGAPREIYREYF